MLFSFFACFRFGKKFLMALTDFRLEHCLFLKIFSSIFCISSLIGCATRIDLAPIIDRSAVLGKDLSLSSLGSTQSLPPGMVRVEVGDTLYQIALKTGRNWRDLAKWNSLSDANYIEGGQLLHIAPANLNAQENLNAVTHHGSSLPLIESTNSDKKIDNFSAARGKISAYVSSNPNVFSVAGFIWPAVGEVKKREKGIDVLGKEGSAILAAAEGKVLYAGSGLRSYGNLIVLKHSNNWLTAYGHNKQLLVEQGDAVLRGQKIAEMGNVGTTDGYVKLYFEVRKISEESGQNGLNKKGSLVDPLSVLPTIK